MKKLLIMSILLIAPILVSAATYINKTSAPLVLSKKSNCTENDMAICDACILDECTDSRIICTYEENEPCIKTESIELQENESVIFENDQDQAVTIMSAHLNEKRDFFPTNDSFNYEITISKYPSQYSKLTINRAQ